ncbi:MAG: nitrogen regulation protein NR(I) [Gammaproteobacteria bacterium]|nr:nitrogen regulation protein NR(I) [Gammaproteobacteria bacterium]MCK5262396.1 nitrogen regulation protein NR(I) [Gammaproteobacteria bacterium]
MTDTQKIWIIDDDDSIRWVLQKALEQADMEVTSFNKADGILEQLKHSEPDAIITDVRMPGMDGLELLEALSETYPDLPVIIMTAHSDLDSAVSAFQGGAFEYLPKPFDIDEAISLAQRACLKRHETSGEIFAPQSLPEIIGEAPAMQEVFRAIGRLSKSNINVLITGESGTGKELVALSLHKHSPRAERAFIALNTAAIPRDLLESELFGHERGAFTGAQAQRKGRFEQADGGTLFLDEIGDMPAELQTRLLRVLADGEFYRVGGHTPIKVDVRIIAATHQNLEQRVKEGLFREDLYHRLNVIRIQLPALRERREDIPALLNLFLHRATKELDVESKQLLPEVENYLSTLEWTGNVRQLENTCHWLAVMTSGKTIHLSDLPDELQADNQTPLSNSNNWQQSISRYAENALQSGKEKIANEIIPDVERLLIEAALKQTRGRKQEAAILLGWGRNTLTRKIKELNI